MRCKPQVATLHLVDFASDPQGFVDVEGPAMTCLPLVILVLGRPFLPMSSSPDEAKMVKQQLQGAWQAVKIEVGGNSVPAEVVKTLKYVFEGDKVTLREGDRTTG